MINGYLHSRTMRIPWFTLGVVPGAFSRTWLQGRIDCRFCCRWRSWVVMIPRIETSFTRVNVDFTFRSYIIPKLLTFMRRQLYAGTGLAKLGQCMLQRRSQEGFRRHDPAQRHEANIHSDCWCIGRVDNNCLKYLKQLELSFRQDLPIYIRGDVSSFCLSSLSFLCPLFSYGIVLFTLAVCTSTRFDYVQWKIQNVKPSIRNIPLVQINLHPSNHLKPQTGVTLLVSFLAASSNSIISDIIY